MCGIFFAVRTRTDAGHPNLTLLDEAAQSAARRGPHGWGVASFLEQAEVPRVVHREGRYTPGAIDDFFDGATWGPVTILGHCRLATTGDLDASALQPFFWEAAGGTSTEPEMFAHNGVCTKADAYIANQPLDEQPVSDSHALFQRKLRLQQMGVDPLAAPRHAIESLADEGTKHIAVSATPSGIFGYRVGHKLHVTQHEGWLYGSPHALLTTYSSKALFPGVISREMPGSCFDFHAPQRVS